MFQSKLGFIGLLNPKRVDAHCFFFFSPCDGSHASGRAFQTDLCSSDTQSGQRSEAEWVEFLFQIDTVHLALSFDIQGHLSWHLFCEKIFQRLVSEENISILMFSWAPLSSSWFEPQWKTPHAFPLDVLWKVVQSVSKMWFHSDRFGI